MALHRTIKGADYSFDRPPVELLKRNGIKAVGRYVNGRGKQLTVSEKKALFAAGIAVWLYYETTAGRARAGHGAGRGDAQAAIREAANVGLAGIPIYMADDDDSTFAQVRPYFEGASEVLGKGRRGVYGSGLLCRQLREAGLVDFTCEAGARGWGNGRRYDAAHILQDPSTTLGGHSIDVCHIAPEAWASFRGGTPPKPPKVWKYGERDLHLGDMGADVEQLQRYLRDLAAPSLVADGDYGPKTEAAKRAAMVKLGWTDASVKNHNESKSIGKAGLGYIKAPGTRPAAFKKREKERMKP